MTTPDQPSEDELAQVKIVFELERDEDGWPPLSAESLWAYDLGDGTFRIDNVPWYVRDLAVDDIVAAANQDGRLVFTEFARKSEHLTIRIYCLTDADITAEAASVVEVFRSFGLYTERTGGRLLALDIPPGSDLPGIMQILVAGQVAERWEWEEGRINDAWRLL